MKRTARRAAPPLLALCAGALLSCAVIDGAPYGTVDPEPDPTSPGTFVGRVGGQHLDGQDAHVRIVSDPVLGAVQAVEITDYSPACSDYAAGVEHRGSLHLTLLVGLKTSSGVLKPTAAGPYTVFNESAAAGSQPNPGAFSIVRFSGRDASSCAAKTSPTWSGATGTVTIGKINSTLGTIDGTYDVKMASGESISGRFSAVGCAEPGVASATCK